MCPIFDHFLSATYGIDDLWDGHGNVSYIPNEEPSLTNEADEESALHFLSFQPISL